MNSQQRSSIPNISHRGTRTARDKPAAGASGEAVRFVSTRPSTKR